MNCLQSPVFVDMVEADREYLCWGSGGFTYLAILKEQPAHSSLLPRLDVPIIDKCLIID